MISILKGLFGLFLLIGSVDMVGRMIWKREDGQIGRWLAWLVSFFTIITPLFYVLSLFKIPINYFTATIFLGLIWIGTGLISKKRLFGLGKIQFKKVIFWLFIYFAIHFVCYLIYYTIPEWDSYRNIQDVRQNLISGSIVSNYRPLFNASMTIVSVLTTIDPYTIFPIILVAAQSSLLLVVYILRTGSKNKFITNLLLASTLAVPVINMEVDMPRAQSVLISLMPIFIYYLYKYYSSNSKVRDFALISWISFVGLSYHEFFFSLFALIVILLTIKLFKFWRHGDKKDKLIVFLTAVTIILSSIFAFNYIFTFRVAIGNMLIILNSFIHNFSFKMWFLSDGLSADHMAVAWSGWKPVLMYYSYYLSPMIVGLIALVIKSIKGRQKTTSFENCLIFVGWIFFIFAEILPRMNIGILPERSWIFFDIMVIVFATSYLKDTKLSRSWYFILSTLFVVGLAGTLYVAYGKKSLTSPDEMKAAQWINKQTPKNAVFISQQANNQLIKFFGEREILSPNEEFFLSDELIQENEVSICESISTIPSVEKANIELKNFDIQKGDPDQLKADIALAKLDIQKHNSSCFPDDVFSYSPMYILFSQEKLKGIYSTREWWRDVNYFGANLDKFSSLPVVYDDGGVKIWRLR